MCTVELKLFASALLPFDEDSTSTVFSQVKAQVLIAGLINRSISDQDSSPGHLRDRNSYAGKKGQDFGHSSQSYKRLKFRQKSAKMRRFFVK